MLTTREASEFMRYVSDAPIDHQSNHHLPIAILSALTANASRKAESEPFEPIDFMAFGQRRAAAEEAEQGAMTLEQQLLYGDW